MFHDTKGCNVVLTRSKSEAAWKPNQTGGLAFSDRPLTHLEKVTITFNGSGAAELGLTTVDPATLESEVPNDVGNLKGYLFLNDIKLHKRTCKMEIVLDEQAKEVVSRYDGGQFTESVHGDKFYIVVEVKFGLLEMTLDGSGPENRKPQFAEVCGRNIKRLNNPAIATSQERSPAALCFYSKPFNSGQSLTLKCTPQTYQTTLIGRYYLLISYIDCDPDELSNRHPSKLDLRHAPSNDDTTANTTWTKIVKLEKEQCTDGVITVKRTGNQITVTSSTEETESSSVAAGRKVWLMFELYGVRVKIEAGKLGEVAEASDEATSVAIRVERIADPVLLQEGIQQNFIHLLQSLEIGEFLDHLYQEDVLTTREVEELHDSERRQATRKLLLKILSKRPVSRKGFMKALKDTKQDFLIPSFFSETSKE